ncbi:FAD-dependent oxidoreductase [Marinicella sp. W31]|uniref:FAD-dependent oxidoreductase n=1 Tax=Marinicella sp. W31 TaxID=3023713 RepID=UPI003757C94C
MNIAIVGAGPAGLTCAIQLAKYKHHVTVFEKKTELSYQGSGVLLQPVGLLALQHLGLDRKAIDLGRRIETISGIETRKNKNIVAVDYRTLGKIPFTVGIDRSALWNLLFETSAHLNIDFMPEKIIQGDIYDNHNRLKLIDQHHVEYSGFDLVIDASGAHSSLTTHCIKSTKSIVQDYGSLWTKLPLPNGSSFDQNCMQLFSSKDNIGIGILPTGIDTISGQNMATLFFNLKWRDWQPDNFDAWKENIIAIWPDTGSLLSSLTQPEQLYLARFRHHTRLSPYGDRIAFIGDSAHSSNPQLGQGINMSLVDAVVLSDVLKNTGREDINQALKKYSKLRRSHVWVYQTLAKMLSPFYQSSNSRAIALRDALYPLLFKLPMIRELTAYILSGTITSPLKKINQK